MRRAYIEEQKREHGRKAIAVLPVHYPKEILTAMDVLAVEMWGPPGPPRGAEAGRLQTYVCAVARNALAFMASGKADVVDAVLFPHTCDSIQGLATLLPDFGGWNKPALRYLHPKGEARPSSRAFVEKELVSLATDLESVTGRPLDTERLRWAIALHREIDGLKAQLLAGRPRLPMDDGALYALLRRGEYLWPEEHLVELRAARDQLRADPVQTGVPVAITGYVPEPMSIFATLNGAGAFVAADDYAAIGRRVVPQDGPVEGDPFAVLRDRTFAAPPCPTRASDPRIRARHLESLFGRTGVKGVIVHEPKFCEPELFDVPAVKRSAAARGLPLLLLEGELELELSAQTVTRIEAFVEMVSTGRAA
ncbi:MAG: 2-hydroxyacyl-CoA dehydratase [Deltaproteobacteria bacterium]|nr:2-hydroxyacyl-CoA dehydratase [Deltaproteobacteria bacterium]